MKVNEIEIYNDVYSSLKAAYHMNDIEKLRNGELIPPKFLMLHPEKYCTNDCEFCAYRASGWFKHGMNFMTSDWTTSSDIVEGQIGRPRGRLIPGISGWDKDIGLSIPLQMKENDIPACEITGSGEPTLWPWITELFDYLGKYEREVALVTHGQTLERILPHIQNLQWMRFSMDSCTKETHSKVHSVVPKMFGIALKNIQKARDMFPKAVMGISFIVTKHNYHEIAQAAEFWKEHGMNNIRYSFEYEPTGTANLSNKEVEDARIQIIKAKEISDGNFNVFGQIERLNSYTKHNYDFSYCGYQMFSWNIGADMKCYPCCIQIYQKRYAFGDLRFNSIRRIIRSNARNKFIRSFNVRKCHPCWLRDRNIAIETLLKPERRLGHVNYV